jgi:hypothetical protein
VKRDWAYFGRFYNEREKKLRDPKDVLIGADGLAASEDAPVTATLDSAAIVRRSPRSSATHVPSKTDLTKPAAGLLALCG